jgi:hypothetical protein
MAISEWRIGKDLEGSGSGLVLSYCAEIRLEEMKNATNNFIQYSLSEGRNFNPGAPEYEARVLTTRPRR